MRVRPLLRALLAALALVVVGAPGAPAGEDDPPSLSRALFLEKTARDPRAALSVYVVLASDPTTDVGSRVEARLGQARCLLLLGQEDDAVGVWKRMLDDPEAPLSAKEEARSRLEERDRAKRAAATDAEEDARREALRRQEEVRVEREGRVAAAKRLVESAKAHMEARRYDNAREDLIRALERNPNDEGAAALLEEVGGYLADRGDLLKQAIRFVSSNRLADFRRLSSDLESLKEQGRKALKDGKPAEAAKVLRDAIQRVDESDFYADLADRREELVLWFGRALDASREKGVPLDATLKVPAPPADPKAGPRAWRGEFFGMLERIFASRYEGGPPLRFHDASAPPNPEPTKAGSHFASSGLPAMEGPGTLRRARWLERYIRAEVGAGSWSGRDRLLERYDDLLVVQNTAGVQRLVEEALAQFSPGPPGPVLVEVRLYAAKPGGVFDALQTLSAKARPSDDAHAVVVSTERIDEQVLLLAANEKLLPLATASLLLGRRHSETVHFREPTAACPLYADKEFPPISIPDRDATYGLTLELYAEDLPVAGNEAALSVVATVRRPDRARLVLKSSGPERQPTMLAQSVEADRRVPHGGSLAVVGLANPFKATGAAGDPAGGTHPDLLILVAARPASATGQGLPDVAPSPPAPLPPTPVPADARETREYDLGSLASEVADQPPPEDWPSTPFSEGARAEAAAARRDAFLAGWLADRAGLSAEAGSVVVREGRLAATLTVHQHEALSDAVKTLLADESRAYAVDVRATEVPKERTDAWLGAAGVLRAADPSGEPARVVRLDADAAARLEERLRAAADPNALFALEARIAARHTQVVSPRSIRSRGIVSDLRVSRRADGGQRIDPVLGSVEEGIVVSVRPTAWLSGLVWVDVSAVLARVDKEAQWRPPSAAGADSAAPVSLPHHAEERRQGSTALDAGQALLLVVDAPASVPAKTVLIRVRCGPPQ